MLYLIIKKIIDIQLRGKINIWKNDLHLRPELIVHDNAIAGSFQYCMPYIRAEKATFGAKKLFLGGYLDRIDITLWGEKKYIHQEGNEI